MPKPQQPELRRSGLGSTDADASELRAGDDLPAAEGMGPVPEENQPNRRPPRDQQPDKPSVPPGARGERSDG